MLCKKSAAWLTWMAPDDFDWILNPSGIKDFWAGVKDSDPRLHMLRRETNLSKHDLKYCLPLWFHGDAEEYVDGRSLMIYSMGSLLATGSTLDTTLLLAAVPKDICCPGTWEALFQKWVASFTHLQSPSSVGRYSFTLWAIRGDQDFYANSLKLPHWRNPKPRWECNLSGEQCLKIQDPIPPNEMRNVEGLVPVFASLALQFNDGTETDELLIQLYDSMSQLLDLMDSSGLFSSDDEASQAMERMNTFLESYSNLAAKAESDKLWRKTIKFHMCRHLAASFQWGNPKFVWCFANEDYVGRISKLAHSASFGTSLLVLSQKVAEKYRHLQHEKEPKQLWENRVAHFKELMRSGRGSSRDRPPLLPHGDLVDGELQGQEETVSRDSRLAALVHSAGDRVAKDDHDVVHLLVGKGSAAGVEAAAVGVLSLDALQCLAALGAFSRGVQCWLLPTVVVRLLSRLAAGPVEVEPEVMLQRLARHLFCSSFLGRQVPRRATCWFSAIRSTKSAGPCELAAVLRLAAVLPSGKVNSPGLLLCEGSWPCLCHDSWDTVRLQTYSPTLPRRWQVVRALSCRSFTFFWSIEKVPEIAKGGPFIGACPFSLAPFLLQKENLHCPRGTNAPFAAMSHRRQSSAFTRVLADRSQMAKSKQQYQMLEEVEAAGAQIRLGNGTYVRAAYIAEGRADVDRAHHAKSMHCTATDCSVSCIIGSLNYSASSRANAEAGASVRTVIGSDFANHWLDSNLAQNGPELRPCGRSRTLAPRLRGKAKRDQDTTRAAPSNGPAMNLLAQSPIATVGQRPRFAARS
ncbi:hypothetical protein AK812_SmicGene3343 [Symbiodinium microadriaticum]|uniref:Phospholipase D-like domain-containing protein n=1 Tax=Symbiodinium microadriaticum TaxID=2951 RepID=A0A1Q9EZ66_SYMMI|nr:hypothetical protein AK812_SmicGene3343 [Symbiodinium microadriaticum]